MEKFKDKFQINGQTGKMPAMPITLSENSYVDLKKKESTIMSPTASALNKRTETVETATMNGVQCPVEVNTATTTTAPISYRLNNNNNINTSINNNSNNNNNNNLPSSSPSNHQHHRQQQSVPPIKRSANDFRFGKSIGEGSFSTVYLAKDIHTQKEYAIKVCEKSHIIREKKQEYIKREREVMHRLINSAGFVNLFCTFQDNKSLYFVMTYAKNGDLLPYINKVGSFDLNCTRFYAAEVVLALEEMHQRAIIHRDLKPENILLDENMHILIADFGSAKVLTPEEMQRQQKELTDNRFQGGSDNENSDEEESAPERSSGGRKRSFVGTAQYVSPEILKGKPTSRATDLWALGCIIYQMISGLPPFRALTEYLIFQKVLKVEVKFPDGFDKTAQDLVQKLLRYDPGQRIGSNDAGFKYTSIRTHPFFEGIQFDTLRHQTPPSIYPYLPGLNADDELRSQYRVPDHLEPGLDDKQLTRLLGLELGTSEAVRQQATAQNVPKNIISILQADQLDVRQRLLENQKLDKWHQFVENEVILKSGFVNKRKGLFARKRMLLLTTGPRLFYIDPVNMVKKGEIPWSPALRVEPKNFKIFFVHTPNRTYYLEDPEGGVMEWCQAIDDVRKCTYSLKN